MIQPSFTQSVARNIGLIPRPALASMFGVAVVFALVDVVWWYWGSRASLAALWLLLPYGVLISSVEYLAVTAIVGVQPSKAGYLRFALTSLLALLPLLIALSLLFTGPVLGKSALSLFLLSMPVAFVIVAFLPAWPVAQALSHKLVTPTRIVRATRGFRWGLFGMACVLGAFNRLVPSVSDAHDLPHALAYAAGQAGINTISTMYVAAGAATAFIFACQNDAGLWDSTKRSAAPS